MKKYVNMLLLGFLIFIIGLICSNIELATYTYTKRLPSNLNKTTEKYALKVNKCKTYEIKKSKYNDNISINTYINNLIKDEIYLEIDHYDTSVAKTYIKDEDNTSVISFSNDLNENNIDMKLISNLIIKCIKDKKIYNYNLLKYSVVRIYANEDVLAKIKIEDYE